MNPNEEKIMEEMKTPHNKYFVPLVWTTSLVTRARKEGRIKDDFGVKTLVDVRRKFVVIRISLIQIIIQK